MEQGEEKNVFLKKLKWILSICSEEYKWKREAAIVLQ